MKAIAGMSSLLILLAPAAWGQGRTTMEADVAAGTYSVESDEAVALAGEVVESSLVGIGRMLNEMRGVDTKRRDGGSLAKVAGDARVELDERTGNYILHTESGVVTFDARTGRYTIDAEDAPAVAGTLLEESLAGIGKMVHLLRTRRLALAEQRGYTVSEDEAGVLMGMSQDQVDALTDTWRRQGLSDAEIDAQLRDLHKAHDITAASMAHVDSEMERVDREMEALDREMERLNEEMEKLEAGSGS